MAKVYTRMGDAGETGLVGGARVGKDHPRIEAIGAVDELNAALGIVRTHGVSFDALLGQIQHALFELGADLATPAASTSRISATHAQALEEEIDQASGPLAELKNFILPGGCPAAASLHWARCVCRRAERKLVALRADETLPAEPLIYLNRLSDLLFVLARAANGQAGVPEVVWQPEAPCSG